MPNTFIRWIDSNDMRRGVIVIVTVMVLSAWILPAHAHVLQTDGTIGAVLHIDPDDDPIAREPARFFFDLKDTTGKFSRVNCNCTARIDNGATPVFTKTFGTVDPLSFNMVFPQRGIYTATLMGEPKKAGAFQPFALRYIIRVDREADSSQQQKPVSSFWGQHTWHLFVGLTIFGYFAILSIRDRRREKRKLSFPATTGNPDNDRGSSGQARG